MIAKISLLVVVHVCEERAGVHKLQLDDWFKSSCVV
jgi:hypothetical protein